MQYNNNIKKIILATTLVFAIQFVFAAFTLTGNKKSKETSNKYSLKYYSSLVKKGYSINTSHYILKVKLSEINTVPTYLQNSYHIELSKGNTTFIYPYKLKVNVAKFKLPARINY